MILVFLNNASNMPIKCIDIYISSVKFVLNGSILMEIRFNYIPIVCIDMK